MAASTSSNEIRLTRVYDAPVRVVWDAWTIPAQVEQWWGPRGFTITTHGRDLRVGGSWRFTMHGPGGVDYPNVTRYLVVEPHRQLVYDHGATEDGPPSFRVTVTFAEEGGRTRMELTMTLPTPEAAREAVKFVKRAGGESTWDRLAEHLAQAERGAPTFVINRSFDAPIARVFEMWANPAHLARWLPPAGTTMRFLRADLAVGKSALFVITGAHGTMHVRAEYVVIDPPRRLVYTQQFVDEREQPAAAPGTAAWPPTLRNTVLLAEEGPGRTRVTVTTEPHGEATAAELAAFVGERPGMTIGWTGSFDALEPLLAASEAPAPFVVDPGARLFHGTKAALAPGALIEPGRSSNYGQRREAAFVYLTGTLDAATWGAELAVGDGPGRIYVVEPTGPIEDDPNLTDQKFPGNPTRSYRTRAPLRVVGEVTDWKGHAPEQLRAMRNHLARLAAQGVEAIED